MKFLVDYNLSPRITRALANLEGEDGDTVVHLADKFPNDTADVDWLKTLGSEGGWAVITSDKHLASRPNELKAWHDGGLVVYILRKPKPDLTFWDQAWKLIKRWPAIKATAQNASPGDGFLVYFSTEKIEKVI